LAMIFRIIVLHHEQARRAATPTSVGRPARRAPGAVWWVEGCMLVRFVSVSAGSIQPTAWSTVAWSSVAAWVLSG
jgi:hypothetical protein